jgi:PAS domain S-box-containing protein
MERIKTNLKKGVELTKWCQQVLGNAHDAIAILDEENKVSYCNRQFIKLTQYDYEELIGVELTKIMNGLNRAEIIKDSVRSPGLWEEPMNPVTEVFRKNGEARKVEVNAAQFFLSAGCVHTIIYCKDITSQLQMEKRIIQSEKLRTLGEMASGIAHNFNNALSAILGHSQLLLYALKDEDLKGTLRTIEKVAQDSGKIVNRLQDFVKKRTHEELCRVDLNTIIRDAVEITKPKWKDESQERDLQIEMVLNLKEIPLVNGDPSALREVNINLIFNAIEAMPQGGRIEFRTFHGKEKVYLQISDTGIGMTEEVKKKIFEPFFTTKLSANSGLGLSTSYEIIKWLGGEIKVKSKVGSGTTFTISFPIRVEGEEEFESPYCSKRLKSLGL